MENKKKKARAKIDKEKIDMTKPLINLLKLGGPEDPCFGTHDPSDSTCKKCGDSEFCQIIKAQNNHNLRGKEEKKSKFKDKDVEEHPEFNDKTLTKFVNSKIKKGYSKRKISRLAIKKFTPYISNFLVEAKIEKLYETK